LIVTKEEIMSSINGDKSRAGRQRKSRFEKREKSRILRQSLAVKPPSPVPPVAATSVAAPPPAAEE
jgi:hypothetical protein